MRDGITVLFLASNPFPTGAALRLDEDVRAVDRAIRPHAARARAELVAHLGTRAGDFGDALLRHDPRIVHFAAQRDDPCLLYLADDHGRPRPVPNEALARLFGELSEWIKLVILNGRDTLPTLEVLSEVVDHVIGMNLPLGDVSAIAFAGAFYGALAMGHTVQRSFALGVSHLESGGFPRSAPVLRVRKGVDPSVPLVRARPARRGSASQG